MGSTQGLYKIYEILNDFNRIRILACLNKKEKTVDEIANDINLSKTIILSQLEYLKRYNIIIQKEKEETIFFKIRDREFLKIVNNITNYVN